MRDTYAKITFRLLLASFLAFVLVGCGGGSGSPGSDPKSLTLSTEAAELPADGGSSTLVTAYVTDSAQRPVEETTAVTFRTTLGVFGNGKTEQRVRTVDDTGVTTVSLITGTTSGTAEVTASVGDMTQRVEVVFYDPHKVGSISLRTGAASIIADGSSQVAVIATVLDADENPEPGKTVAFSTTLGVFFEENPIPGAGENRHTEAVTDVDGEARVILISGTAIGTAEILASVEGLNASASVLFTAGEPFTIALRAAPSTVKPGGETDIIARIFDLYGNPIAGETVVFSDLVNLSGGGLEATTADTNVNGEARVTYTAGSEAGVDTLQAAMASDSSMKATTPVEVDPDAIVIGGIEVTAGSSTLVADGTSKVKIRATVTDIDGKPAIGKEVTFTSRAGLLNPDTDDTSDLGLAEVYLQASTFAGPVIVEGECDGFIDSVTVTFIPGEADHIILYAFPNVVPPNGATFGNA